MSLYWPPRRGDIDLTQPRLHAFVIGIGDYPHLMGGTGHPAVSNMGLRQLDTTLHTVPRIVEWLATRYENPACPLGSIEMLRGPSATLSRPDGTLVDIDAATMANIVTAFNTAWWPRTNARKDNIAFFYFAGHGISTATQYVLPADFGDPASPDLWMNCIDFDGLRTGMRSNQANVQLFFMDACREKPIDALIQNNMHGAPLCSSIFSDQVDTSAAYYAAGEGRQAYGPETDITYFASALLESLEGVGAVKKQGGWVVDTFSLGNAVGHLVTYLAALHNQPLTCNPNASGKEAIIHHPPSGLVRASIGCRTPQANAEAEILLRRRTMSVQSSRGDPRPWSDRVEPGDWDIGVSFQSFASVRQQETLMPPLFELEVPV